VLVLAGGLMFAAIRSHREEIPVYSQAALQAHIAGEPEAWADRTVRVRAVPLRCVVLMAGPGTPCLAPDPSLVDVGAADSAPLPLVPATPSSSLLFLHRLPLLGRLVPDLQTVTWGVPGVYRIQIRAGPCWGNGAVTCYVAALLDAAPDSL
jgi:hypothetical protein